MIRSPSRARNSENIDEEKLVAELRRLAPSVERSADRAWVRQPAVRVIDCVLSLNRPYDRFVVPRLDRFEQRYHDVGSVADLATMIRSYPSPHAFVRDALDYNHEARATMLAALVEWLIAACHGDASLANLERWAASARPGIPGFGLGGLQYLRMLFGADTTKPDLHVCRKVAEWVGHRVPPVRALELLEKAAPRAGLRVRDVDTTIWQVSARGAGG